MANFDFCCVNNLGFSHCCGVIAAEGHGSIELSDEEVAILVELIRKKGTTDVWELDLTTAYPEIFQKLDDAHRQVAREATIGHWYLEGFYNCCYEYDTEELMDYCSETYDFTFEYNEEDYYDEDGELDEDALFDHKYESFVEWLEPFVESMNTQERITFLSEHMNADVDLSNLELDYMVNIPQGIITLVKIS
mgnify:CR=1 FL=1